MRGTALFVFCWDGFREVQEIDKDFPLTTTCFMRILREKPMKRYMQVLHRHRKEGNHDSKKFIKPVTIRIYTGEQIALEPCRSMA